MISARHYGRYRYQLSFFFRRGIDVEFCQHPRFCPFARLYPHPPTFRCFAFILQASSFGVRQQNLSSGVLTLRPKFWTGRFAN